MCVPKPIHEFDIDFARSQNLQRIQGKLHRTVVMLKGTLRIANKLSDHARTLTKWMELPSRSQFLFQMELRQISSDMESFVSVAENMIQQCQQLRLAVG